MNDILTSSIFRYVLPAGWVSLSILSISFILIQPVDGFILYLPFILSVLFLGMPHGAVDHLIPRYLSDTSTRESIALIVALYAFLGGLYTILWFIYPFACLILFILLTILHWGQGDNYVYSVLCDQEYIRNKAGLLSGVLLKGSIPMLLPYLFHRERYADIVSSIVSLFDSKTMVDQILLSSSSATVVSIFMILIATVYFVNALNYGVSKLVVVDAFEVLFLTVFFYVAPPVYAIGVYFCFWHSIRHIARLLDADDKIDSDSLYQLSKRFVYVSTPMTIGGIALFATVAVVTDASLASYDQFLSSYLIAISVMTLPHFVVVSWMDKKQSVYDSVRF